MQCVGRVPRLEATAVRAASLKEIPGGCGVASAFSLIPSRRWLWPKKVGMANALELLDILLEGTHHRGGDDVWNIGKILGKLLLLK